MYSKKGNNIIFKNKDKILGKSKQRYLHNKDKLLITYSKQYYYDNRLARLQYYYNNKDVRKKIKMNIEL